MSPEMLEQLITIAAVVAGAVATGGYGVHRWRKRNGHPASPTAPTVVRVDGQQDVDPGGDTGRFMVALQNAPEEDVRAFTHAVLRSIDERPATQGDVQRTVRAEVDKVRTDINGQFAVHSTAIGGLRAQVAKLPCQQSDDGCEFQKVAVTK